MKKSCPENCLELLQQSRLERPDVWGNRYPEEFYNTLEVFPEFARDTKVHAMLRDALEKEPLRNRMLAARILLRSGDPLGILHLTYNSLSTHPLLKAKQDLASLWPEAYLLREADQLTDECIDLLIADLEPPHAFWHMDILAALPAESIVPRMRALLGEGETRAMVAAYVLALKGNDEGRPLLEGLVEKQKLLNLALIALSHIPDFRAISYLKSYADPKHPIYNRQYDNLYISHAQRSGLMQQAQCRLFLLEQEKPLAMHHTMEEFYLTPIQAMIKHSDLRSFLGRSVKGARGSGKTSTFEDVAEAAWRWIKPPRNVNYRLFVINSGIGLTSGALTTAVNAPDFLSEFATPQDRAYCAEIQRASIRALLKVIGWRTLGNGSDMGIRTTFLSDLDLPPTGSELAYRNARLYFPGVEIHYGPQDYEHAAVDWILNPGRYRTSSWWPKMLME